MQRDFYLVQCNFNLPSNMRYVLFIHMNTDCICIGFSFFLYSENVVTNNNDFAWKFRITHAKQKISGVRKLHTGMQVSEQDASKAKAAGR